MTKKKGEKKMEDDGIRHAENMVDPDDGGLARMTRRVAECEALCEAMRADWATLNGLLNDTARAHAWCSEYEERLVLYNGKFTTLELTGRAMPTEGRSRDPYLPTARQLMDRAEQTRARREEERREEEQRRLIMLQPVGHDPCACSICRERHREAARRGDHDPLACEYCRRDIARPRNDVYTQVRVNAQGMPVWTDQEPPR